MEDAPSEFERVVRMNNKDFFVDLKTNEFGRYVKISERRNGNRNTLLVPVSGLEKLIDALNDAMDVVVASEVDNRTTPGKAEKKSVDNPSNEKAVFVSGFPRDTSEPDVVHFMRAAGVIFSVDMKGKGAVVSAIVEYTSADSARKAIEQFNENTYLGHNIRCRADRGSSLAAAKMTLEAKTVEPKELDELKVFCTNLPFDTTDEELLIHFSAAGKVKTVTVNMGRKGRSMGTGVVEFQGGDSARNAIAQLNGKPLKGRDLRVREYYK